MSSRIERQFKAHGLNCAVLWVNGSHRCGYVRIPDDHSWAGLDYNDPVPAAVPIDLNTPGDEFDEGVGTIAAFAFLLGDEDQRSRDEQTMLYQVRVHGGLTYSGTPTGLKGHWVGFDCAHHGDTPDRCSESYAATECENLAAQIAARAQVAS